MDSKSQRICMAQPLLTLCLVMLTTTATAFMPSSGLQQQPMRSRSARQLAPLDPTDLADFVHHHPALDAILSTLYANDVLSDDLVRQTAAKVGAAHGHSNSLFGSPDPWLQDIKSIPPPHLDKLGVDVQTGPVEAWPESAKLAFKQGVPVVDPATFQSGGGITLPGFKPPVGILPREAIADESLKTIQKQSLQAGQYLNLLEKLPTAALAYAIVDFGLLRRNVDLYKEDIEEEPTEVAQEVMVVTGVRLGVFFLIGLVTAAIFGHPPPMTPPPN